MNPMFLLTSMMAFAFSLDDEDDEDYKPRVVTKFPDISSAIPLAVQYAEFSLYDFSLNLSTRPGSLCAATSLRRDLDLKGAKSRHGNKDQRRTDFIT